MGFSRIGSEFCGLLKSIEGCLVFATIPVCLPQLDVKLRVIGLALDRRFYLRQ
jgi:hypothetical protein